MRRLSGTTLDPKVVSALGRAVARHKTLVFGTVEGQRIMGLADSVPRGQLRGSHVRMLDTPSKDQS